MIFIFIVLYTLLFILHFCLINLKNINTSNYIPPNKLDSFKSDIKLRNRYTRLDYSNKNVILKLQNFSS